MVVADAASAIVARSSPSSSGGNPSPTCASTAVMPSASARRAHAYALSFVPRAPPTTPMASGPPAVSASRTSCAVAASALLHDTSMSPASPRTSGAATRSGELTASNENRPRSQSHPQFTGSESMPW
jgi:hypothetical protein